MKSITRRSLTLALVAWLTAGTSPAATGGPDELGTRWADRADGCETPRPLGDEAMRFDAPADVLGPFELGFLAWFQGAPVDRAWISPHGWLAFADPGADDALPRVLPDATAPKLLMAASWTSAAAPAELVQIDAQPGSFEVRWQWGGFATRLGLARTGDVRLHWDGPGISIPDPDTVVAYQDASRTRGVTFIRGREPVEPGFSPQITRNTTCLTPATLLDCTAPLELACGGDVSASLEAGAESSVGVWPCHDEVVSARERVVELLVPEPSRARLEASGARPVSVVHVPRGECAERRCLEAAVASLEIPLLPAGRHRFAVDASAPTDFTLSATCELPRELECGASALGSTRGELSRVAGAPGVPVPLPGPDERWLVEHVAAGPLVVTLSDVESPLWVTIASASGDVLAAGAPAGGAAGAALFDAAPGAYVVTVDGEGPEGSDYRISASCSPRLDASGAMLVACGDRVAGDTSGREDLLRMAPCLDDVLTGGLSVHELDLGSPELVSARLARSQPGQRVLLVAGEDETRCLAAGESSACALMPAGRVLVVVAGVPSASGEYVLDIECGRRAAARGVSITALDATASGTSCRDLRADGVLRVEVTNGTETTTTPPVTLVAYEDRDGTPGFESASDLELGRLDVTSPVAPGESTSAEIPLDGRLSFRGAVLGASVVGVPSSELETRPDPCAADPEPASLEPVLEWAWSGSSVRPEAIDVMSSPLAADLDGDGVTEVVALTQEDLCGVTLNGVVRALDGRDGVELWAATDEEAAVFCLSQLAVGDLTGDGRLEIVGHSAFDWNRLVALDASGSVLWLSDERSVFSANQGAPAIGDVDGDGSPEIAYGPDLFDADGSLAWLPEDGGTRGALAGGGVSSVIVDLDGDGLQEVVAGPTAYEWDGSGTGRIRWRAEGVPDGGVAVGQLDDDSPLEVVVSSNGSVTALDGEDGRVLWSRRQPILGDPGASPFISNGYPTLADVDSDGTLDVLVVTFDSIAALDARGEVLWQSPVEETSSGITGVTAFDLDGDGDLEVLHADERAVRILRGADGALLFTLPHDSGTALEMPTVADVDGDGSAELLVGDNRSLNGGAGVLAGVRAYGGVGGGWAGARPIWNQLAYHSTNVNDDGSTPVPTGLSCLPPAPSESIGYRVQQPVRAAGEPLPNLTVALVSIETVELAGCKREVRVTARVANAGDGPSAATRLAFFHGDPSAGGTLESEQVIPALAPRERVDVVHAIGSESGFRGAVVAVVDRDDEIVECAEDDNRCETLDGALEDAFSSGPDPVGPALRAIDHGSADAPQVRAVFDWRADLGAPREDLAHYHVLRGDDPRRLALLTDLERLVETSFEDETPRAAEVPRVHFYRVVAADGCERQER